MSITFEDIVVAFNPFDNRFPDTPISEMEKIKPGKQLAAYRVGKSLRSLKAAYQDYQDKRAELIRELGDEDERGNAAIDPNDAEAVSAFTEAMNQFIGIEPVDLKLYPVKIGDLDGCDVQPRTYAALWFLIEDEDE